MRDVTTGAPTTRYCKSRSGRHKPVPHPRSPQHWSTLGCCARPAEVDLSPTLGDLSQPVARPMSQEQHVNEVKGIYSGVVGVEKQCVQTVQRLRMMSDTISDLQWRCLMSIHRTLLYEYHDLLLASQYPSTSPFLQSFASKYAVPTRMWRYGMQLFLELLRHRLPESLDHMLVFIHEAYHMMTLSLESVPAFEKIWIECLGHLARYRMAIEEINAEDRAIWSKISQTWYHKAADRSPQAGRIQHDLAVLAYPDTMLQIFHYTKSLTCANPFQITHESIRRLFDSLIGRDNKPDDLSVADTFVTAHAALFIQPSMSGFTELGNNFISRLNGDIGWLRGDWRHRGLYIASTNIASLLGYGAKNSVLTQLLLEADNTEDQMSRWNALQKYWPSASRPMKIIETGDAPLANSVHLTFSTLTLVLQRIRDPNVLPFVHANLVFLWNLAFIPPAFTKVEADVPWVLIANFLNAQRTSDIPASKVNSKKVPVDRCLPDDFIMRGQIWCRFYHSRDFFEGDFAADVDYDERTLEVPNMMISRRERCLWLGIQIASVSCCTS